MFDENFLGLARAVPPETLEWLGKEIEDAKERICAPTPHNTDLGALAFKDALAKARLSELQRVFSFLKGE